MSKSTLAEYFRRCHIGDCQQDSTGDVTLRVTSNGGRTFDPPLEVAVAACDEHRRQFAPARRHWGTTPPEHIPYLNRLALGVAMGALFGAAGANATGSLWGWFAALAPLGLVALGIWDEWSQGY